MAENDNSAPGDQANSEALADRSAKAWLDQITEATRYFDKYQTRCDNIDKLYADADAKAREGTDREFAIFWANLEVLKPTLYSRPPVPVVVPRFKDRKELPRQAAEVLERSLVSSFESDDIDATMRLCRDDLAIHSRGVIWCRYERKGDGYECVRKEQVDRKDFLHQPARKWSEVGWVARRAWLTRKQGMKRFGDGWLKASFTDKRDDDDEKRVVEKAPVWELWSKDEGVVVWVSPGVEDILDRRVPGESDDSYAALPTLDGFFPCPRPAYGTLQRRTLIPVPDFVYYKDQVEEINELTARISSLSEALRLKGFYPGGASDVGDAIETAMKDLSNNALLIPINSLAAFGSNGGLKDAIVWLPVKDVAEVITALVALRKQLIEDVYQITGLSDIMRGETEASETATAQRIKSQYGSIRIRDKQGELVRIARDVTRIEAEIIAENFSVETLAAMSQTDLPRDQQIAQQVAQITGQIEQAAVNPEIKAQLQNNPESQQQAMQMLQAATQQVQQLEQTITLEKVVALLREERIRPFVLEIETDSTIQPDEDAQKQRASEFITAVGGFMQQAVGAVQMVPQMAPLAAELLQFTASQFRVGRSVDGAIDEFADQMKQLATQPKPPPPEQMKAEAEAKAIEAEAAQKEKDAERQAVADQRKDQMDERKAVREADAADKKLALEERLGAITLAIKEIDLAIARTKMAEAGMEETEGEDGKTKVTDKADRHAEAMTNVMAQQSEALAKLAGAMKEMADNAKLPRTVVGPSGKTYTATVN